MDGKAVRRDGRTLTEAEARALLAEDNARLREELQKEKMRRQKMMVIGGVIVLALMAAAMIIMSMLDGMQAGK